MSRYRIMQLGSPTGLYGAERWILALVRHLDAARVESIVGVIRDAPTLDAPLCNRAQELGFHAHVIEALGKFNWAAVGRLRSFLREHRVQILHTHGYKTDIIGLLATRQTGCRIVSTPHGWSAGAGPTLMLYEGLDRAILPFFDAVAPLSNAIFDGLKRWPGMRRKLHLIHNGVDISEIDSVTEIAVELRAWREQGVYVVGYIGQLIERKGLVTLLEAFARLDAPAKKLVMIGEGTQRAQLEAIATALGVGAQVKFFGFRADRLAFLKGFDVFVLPSKLEGIPRCLMEAMAAGTLVIASDIPGSADLVQHERTGLLFPVGDIAALALQLQKSLRADVRAKLTAAARTHVVQHYSASAMAASYLALYAKMLDGAGELDD